MSNLKTQRVMSSAYMQWSKSHVHVKYNLAGSGVMNCPFSMLPVKLEDLEITGESYYGYAPLQQQLALHCGVTAEQIFSTIGTSLANHMAMAVIIEPGDDILIEEPTYELLISTAQYLGATVKRFPRRMENAFQILPEDIERAITPKTKLIVLTNLHNPSGVLTDEGMLKHIGQIASSTGARVLVDEVYLDAAFEQSPRSSIHLGEEFVVTNSLTKAYGLSGLRCGWVLAKPDLIQRIWHLNDLFGNHPPHAAELLSVIAFQHLDTIRAWARSIVAENQHTLQHMLRQRDDLECIFPGFGTTVFPKLRNGRVEELCAHLMQRYQTAVAPGKFFGKPDHFRIGLGGKPEMFREGLRNVCRTLDELSGRKRS
jgi:hypothetical protein